MFAALNTPPVTYTYATRATVETVTWDKRATFQIRRKYKTLNSIVITSTTPNEITRPWLPIFADCKLRSRPRHRLRVSAGMLLRESLIPGVGRWRCWWGWHAWLAEHAFTERPIAERRHEILAKPFCVSRCNDISVHVWVLRYFEINLY